MLTLTESKAEMLLKIGAMLNRVYTRVSTIDGVAAIEVDTEKIGVLNLLYSKLK